jgi:hypothetical protein
MRLLSRGDNIMTKEEKEMYEFYKKEVIRLSRIFDSTKSIKTKSEIFDKIMKLKDKYDYLYDKIEN